MKNSARGAGLALGMLLLAAPGGAAEEEGPFAKDEGISSAERLRKIIRKMSRIEEKTRGWLSDPARSDPAGQEVRRALLTGVERQQKEIESDLARLVLHLQKT